MDNNLLPDPSQIDSWPKAVAFMFQVIVVVCLPLYLKKNHDALKRNTAITAETNTTLTEKNGGSSVRDTLDDIKETVYTVRDSVSELAIRVSDLEGHSNVTEHHGTVTIVTDATKP